MDGDVGPGGNLGGEGGHGDESDKSKDKGGDIDVSDVPAGVIEAEDERQEVNSQRQDPEKGHYGDILGDFVGDGEQDGGGARWQEEPEQAFFWVWRGRLGVG